MLGIRQLVRVLTEYVKYFNQARPHQGIEQRIPESRLSTVPSAATGNINRFPTTSAAAVRHTAGKVIAFPVSNGLHHTYRWAA